ncbi:hypothetical protein BD414DRAFT_414665 [Trametes punicea]|nr:hypothetical protein BD414DRAFT_414665 [Trametes punicea]
MSFDTQIALARPPRAESTHLSRAARQVVPPFLQKLYEIVNDPANEELIRWSENGDSFYVLNHEKFAREVLGRWFKHQKFASFVRQLNMYGFHKIPHLQQGVLKSDTDTEPWHFEHPNFHRGQPDLLCLIQRKKQPTHGNSEDPAAIDIHDPNSPNGLANLSAGQVMDINSIVNGIAVIKRHQQAISADLSALKQSNDALWKEAVAARQRHAKHQDTINRILKFLAGVFGHGDESGHSSDGSHSPPQVTPRVRQRLMIGDSRVPAATKGKHVDIVEVEDDEADLLRKNRGRSPFSGRFSGVVDGYWSGGVLTFVLVKTNTLPSSQSNTPRHPLRLWRQSPRQNLTLPPQMVRPGRTRRRRPFAPRMPSPGLLVPIPSRASQLPHPRLLCILPT